MSIQLVEMNIDGSEGHIYNIDHDNVVIGRYLFTPKSFGKLLTFPLIRDKGCNIRIKLPSISRQHAKISFDENRNVILSHLSTTNPSFINAKKTEKSTVLNHGDLLAFGDRIFMFKNTQIQLSSVKKVLGSICEANESIIEPDAKENQNVNSKKTLATPLKKKIESLRKPETPRASLQLQAKSPGKLPEGMPRSLPTPLRNGIQLKRRDYDTKEMTSPPKEQAIGKSEKLEKRSLPTPLRKQILNKQTNSKKDESQQEVMENPPAPKKINFSLQEAIIAKKKTLKQVNGAIVGNSGTVKAPTPVKSITKISLVPTPLRKAIALRREKVELAMKMESEPKIDNKNMATEAKIQSQEQQQQKQKQEPQTDLMVEVRKTLFSPLKNEIVKRRKSLRMPKEVQTNMTFAEKRDSFVDMEPQVLEANTDNKVFSPVIEKVAIAISETLNSPINSLSPMKALATPLRKAIQARRVSFGVKQTLEFLKDSTVDTQNAPVYLEALSPPQRMDVEESENPIATEEQDNFLSPNKSPLLATESAVNELMANTQQLFTDILNAQSLQISTDVINHEDHSEIFDVEESKYLSPKVFPGEEEIPTVAENVALLLSEKKSLQSLFSPITPGNERAKVNLLNSIEKKSRTQYLNIVSSMESDRESFLSDIVAHLSDLDMEIIESYTQKLISITSKSLLDENDAFGIVLDAYIRGIECLVKDFTEDSESKISKCLVFEDSVANDQINSEVSNAATPSSNDSDTNEDYVTENLSGIHALFKLPKCYVDAHYDVYDEELVETYAEELCITAGVSSAVAYGTALDSFLADPVKFRHFIGRLELPANQKIHFLVPDNSESHHSISNIADISERENRSIHHDVELVKTENDDVIPHAKTQFTTESVEVAESELVKEEIPSVEVMQEGKVDTITDSSDIIEIPINSFQEVEVANENAMEIDSNLQLNNISVNNEEDSNECAMEVVSNPNNPECDTAKEEIVDEMPVVVIEEIPQIVSVEESAPTTGNGRKRKVEVPKNEIAVESTQSRKKTKKQIDSELPKEENPEIENSVKETKRSRGRSGKQLDQPTEIQVELVEPTEKPATRSTRSSKKATPEIVEAPKQSTSASTAKASKGRTSKKSTKKEEEKQDEAEEIEEALAILCDK